MSHFATVTFVGPGEADAARLRELLLSLQYYEPEVARVVLIDDASHQDYESLIPAALRTRTVILENPRRGRGDWWQGGLCVGLCAGLKSLAADESINFIVRLDTDALVISPFAHRLHEKFSQHPRAGLLGTWEKYAVHGHQRLPHAQQNQIAVPILEKASRRFAVWRHSDWPTRIQSPFSKDDRIVRRLILSARKNGYQGADFLQGGAYALRGDMIRAANEQGYLSESAYLRQFYSEDVLATMVCFAVDYRPLNFNEPGEVFAVNFQGLPDSPQALVDSNYAILHSYKNDRNHSEQEILDYFRNRRD